jgi:hypothetical protein
MEQNLLIMVIVAVVLGVVSAAIVLLKLPRHFLIIWSIIEGVILAILLLVLFILPRS